LTIEPAEHVSRPWWILRPENDVRTVLRPGGTITVIEGDHGSAYFYPDSEAAREAIRCQVELQRAAGGNAMIGRELYPLLRTAGFSEVRVSPRMMNVDSSRPDLVDGFTKKTFTAMIEGVRKAALEAGIVDPEAFDRGLRDLYATAGKDGVFCYTFFKAVAYRARPDNRYLEPLERLSCDTTTGDGHALIPRSRLHHLVGLLGDPKPIGEVRERIVHLAEGKVLEIGVGPGVNFVHYNPARVSKVRSNPTPG
jgi:hypothetical protein